MKRLIWILLMAILLAACAPASTPTPTSAPTATALPPNLRANRDLCASNQRASLAPVSLAGPSAGTTMTWVDGSVLVYIPSGEFIMGLGYGDAPTKTFTLDAYWIQQTEVTNKCIPNAWRAEIAACQCRKLARRFFPLYHLVTIPSSE